MANRLKVARHPGTFFDFVMYRVWGSDVFDFLIPELHSELFCDYEPVRRE